MFKMKQFLAAIVTILCSNLTDAQVNKPIIDSGMIGTWPSLNGDIKISTDGRYVAYTVQNQPIGNHTLVLQSLKTNWKLEREIKLEYLSSNFYFSNDSRHLIWQNGDSLFLESMGQNQQKLLANIVGPILEPSESKGSWLAWHDKEHPKHLVLFNLVTGKKKIYPGTSEAVFDKNGVALLLQYRTYKYKISWINLSNIITEKIIFETETIASVSSFHFDAVAQQLCFLVREGDSSSIYYYKTGMPSSVKKYNTNLVPPGWQMNSLQGFNSTGHYILANLTSLKEPYREHDLNMVSVDVWSYRDEVIHPAQIAHSTARYSYIKKGLLSISVITDHMQINVLNPQGMNMRLANDYCLLSSDTIPPPVAHYEHWVLPPSRMWLQHLKGGEPIELPFDKGYVGISPDGCWLLFWVNKKGQRANFYSYEIATKKTWNITESLPASVAMEKIQRIDSIPVGMTAWYGQKSVLIYDNYDIWQVDLTGKKANINLTSGYGLHNNIKLRLVEGGEEGFEPIELKDTEKLLLTGYNEQTKYNGFFILLHSTTEKKKLQLLSMQPFSWFKTRNQVGVSSVGANRGILPLLAGHGRKQVWVLMGESAIEYANYYYTYDFKQFIPLTRLAPHKKYNWLTTEMVNWPLPNGQTGQGILYKPENFDSTKKYPVIFYYYERKSGWMYQFSQPAFSQGGINIPWLVSRGYLVFTPDIPFSDGSKSGISSGEHAWMAVESAAANLSKRAYVDSLRLGLQGISFGGELTLCIYTRSKRFAAAIESAGFTDDMSIYLELVNAGGDWTLETTAVQAERESHHALFGATPWEKPELYLNNSSVWKADQIGGPLLIMHNKKDDQVPWKQGVAMYMAMRRLGKPCWMLQYDGESHGLSGKPAQDYTIRMTQYFDHYLKGTLAPRWMTEGIPARFKQVENRYELDPSGHCSKYCPTCTKGK